MPRLIERVLDQLLPPLCLSCDVPVGGNQTLCPACWKAIRFIAAPFCATCGAPFEVPVEAETLCGACLAKPPDFTKARSVLLYDDASKNLILSFKHSDRLHPAPALAQWLHRAGEAFLSTADIIVPVPLHRWRLFRRRYNQAALLAQELGRRTGKRVIPDALLRIRATASQGHLSREQRHQNIAGAIRPHPRHSAALTGKTVILIDDVTTTGATINACARALRKAGAAQILVLTLARAGDLRS